VDHQYYSTFIAIAEDCPATAAEVPTSKGDKKSVAELHYEMIAAPYRYTQEDVLFATYARDKDIDPADAEGERAHFFSKGQACLRASALGKRYGWGLHFNEHGQVALVAMDSPDYQRFLGDPSLKQLKAMRSKRA
jgi:hypothetical protein